MVFLSHFFIFLKLLFQLCVSVNDADKTRSVIQVIAVGEAYMEIETKCFKQIFDNKWKLINDKFASA